MYVTATKRAAALLLFAVAMIAGPLAPATAEGSTATATVQVDAREAARGILNVRLHLPVHPGPLTLVYPKWLPGRHGPAGPITNLAGPAFSHEGTALAWRRDDIDMYAFHLQIPEGVTSIDAGFEVLTGLRPDGVVNGLEAPRTATDSLMVLEWHQVVLYPADSDTDTLTYAASVRLPQGWKHATALTSAAAGTASSSDDVTFEPTSLTTLLDSTLIAGKYLQSFDLGGEPRVRLHVAADGPAALNLTPTTIDHYKQLVIEARALFGATHYRHYDFLYVLTDQIMPDGLEHHESSDNRSPYRTFLDDDVRRAEANLLAHEYSHSWNGKFRRPVGIATRNYQDPMRGELLWVYEGLTEYLGDVLAARSGLLTVDEFRGELAHILAGQQSHTGRQTRNLRDTTIAAQLLYVQPRDWAARLRRQEDFYQESALLWLEADMVIRQRSGGRRSLDDFCRHFYGPPSTAPQVRPYDFDTLVNALNDVQPYDWRKFWEDRLDRHESGTLDRGLAQSGWSLAYDAGPAVMHRAHEADDHDLDLRFSLGFYIDDNAEISDIVPESPADRAGLAPGDRIIAIGERKYSKDDMRDALSMSARNAPIDGVLIQRGDNIRRVPLSYAGGPREPQLVRINGTPDVLAAIAASASRCAAVRCK